jgi:hypothetical protein
VPVVPVLPKLHWGFPRLFGIGNVSGGVAIRVLSHVNEAVCCVLLDMVLLDLFVRYENFHPLINQSGKRKGSFHPNCCADAEFPMSRVSDGMAAG